MKNKYRVLVGMMLLTGGVLSSCDRTTGSTERFEDHAVQLMDSTLRYFQAADCPCGRNLFYEYYPKSHEIVTYEVNGDTLEHEKMAYLWPVSGLLAGVNSLLQLTGDSQYQDLLEQHLLPMSDHYYDTLRAPKGFQSYPTVFGRTDRYYDDNVWMGMELLNTYRLTENKKYLERAETLWNFLESGRDTVMGGGLYWCEQKRFTKNTCSNAPAAVLALQLHEVTGNADYLKQGTDIYDWVKRTLRDPEDGLYLDNIQLGGKKGTAKYAYNSGQMMQAAVLLHRATGKEDYLEEARQLAEVCAGNFMETDEDGEGLRLKNGNVWFAAVLLRAYEELYKVDGLPKYIQAYQTTLQRLWHIGRDANGLFANNRFGEQARYEKEDKWLLTQGALVEMYARLALLMKEK